MAERFDRHRAGIATGLAIAILLLVASTQLLPWLTQQRDEVVTTPVRSDLSVVHPIPIAAGERVCLGEVTLDPSAQIARLTLAEPVAAGARLAIETAGAGQAAAVALAPQPSGHVDLPVAMPEQAAVGTLCVRNLGARTVRLAGTGDPRALTRSAIVVDGERSGQGYTVTLLAADRRSLLERVPQLVDRAAALSSVGPWLLWLLLPLVLLGVPAAVIAALHLALRDTEPPSRPDRQ
jgi:hypothetical protein